MLRVGRVAAVGKGGAKVRSATWLAVAVLVAVAASGCTSVLAQGTSATDWGSSAGGRNDTDANPEGPDAGATATGNGDDSAERSHEAGARPGSLPVMNGDLSQVPNDDYNYAGAVEPGEEWDKSMASASASATPAPSPPPPNITLTDDEDLNAPPLTALQVEEQDKEEASMFLAIFSCIVILVVGFLGVHALRTYNLSWFPEAWVFFCIGIFLAIAMAVSDSDTMNRISITLHKSFSEIFFVLLLPPIIFESGYSMDKRPFFDNFWAICTYAFLGTLVSTAVVGTLVWAVSQLPFVQTFTALEAHVFGSIVSATDPVTVLAVFQELRVDRTLYALVFGESVLNDAVAIVLYHTLLTFEKQPASVHSVFVGVVFFFENFLGSLLIGSLVGVSSALLLKHVHLRHRHAEMERALITLLPFMAYMISEGLQFSGVVAILFAGITMAHYTVRNLSSSTRRWSLQLFKVLASLAEALVFVYIGLATPRLFARALVDHWFIMVFVVAACLLGRSANVELCTHLVNRWRKPGNRVAKRPKFVLWFSGLRGGVAFALSSAAKNVVNDRHTGVVMEACSLFVVVVSMLGIGGSIGPLVRKLELCEPSPHASPVGHRDPKARSPTPRPHTTRALSERHTRHTASLEGADGGRGRPRSQSWDGIDGAAGLRDCNPGGHDGDRVAPADGVDGTRSGAGGGGGAGAGAGVSGGGGHKKRHRRRHRSRTGSRPPASRRASVWSRVLRVLQDVASPDSSQWTPVDGVDDGDAHGAAAAVVSVAAAHSGGAKASPPLHDTVGGAAAPRRPSLPARGAAGAGACQAGATGAPGRRRRRNSDGGLETGSKPPAVAAGGGRSGGGGEAAALLSPSGAPAASTSGSDTDGDGSESGTGLPTWASLDQQYLTPFFTNNRAAGRGRGAGAVGATTFSPTSPGPVSPESAATPHV